MGFTFSKKSCFALQPNSITEYINRYRGSHDFIDLSAMNPTDEQLFLYDEILKNGFNNTLTLPYEAEPFGPVETRKTIATWYGKMGYDVSWKSIVCTAGTSDAYGYIFKLIGNPFDEILVPQPGYPLFEILCQLDCISPIHYKSLYSWEKQLWSLDFARLGFSISTVTKAIITVNPNNPTGAYMVQSDVEALGELCRSHSLCLISDEVFFPFALDVAPQRNPHSLCTNKSVLTFTLSGLSKCLGLPQVKLSWIVVSGPDSLMHEALEKLEMIADAYLAVSATASKIAHRLIPFASVIQKPILYRIKQNYATLHTYASTTGLFRVYAAEGGWYGMIQCKKKKPVVPFICTCIEKFHVLIHPGFYYSITDSQTFVLSLLSHPDRFQDGITRLCKCLSEKG